MLREATSGLWACRHGVVGYHIRLTRERSAVRSRMTTGSFASVDEASTTSGSFASVDEASMTIAVFASADEASKFCLC